MSSPTTTVRTSRVGKRPVPIPAGVTVKISSSALEAKGPKGTFVRKLPPHVLISEEGGALYVKAADAAGGYAAQFQGLARSLVKNVLHGVSHGYEVALDLIGTGYRAELKGQELTLALGLSHLVKYPLPDAVKARVEIIDVGGTKKPRLLLSSYDNELLSQTASRLRSFRPPEPYKGKGVRYVNERIREKAGKAGKGAGKK